MTLTDRIEMVAPWGFIRDYDKLQPGPWRVATEDDKRNLTRSQGWWSPAQAAAALEDCEQCHGGGVVARTEMVVGFPTPMKAHCPSCASLRACVEGLLC